MLFQAEDFTHVIASGSDAQHFLNNQLTRDVPDHNNEFEACAWCNPKGRVITTLDIARIDQQTFALIMPSDHVAAIIAQFQRYIFRAKVSFEILDTPLSVSDSATDAIGQISYLEKPYFYHARAMSDAPSWLVHLVSHNQPVVGAQQSERWIAQHLLMDEKGMIAFDKGCYPGQEVIARIHFKGQVKKALVLTTSPQIFDANSSYADGTISGTVFRSVRDNVDSQALIQVVT